MNKFIVALAVVAPLLGGASCTTEQKTQALQVGCEADAIVVPLAEVGATAATITSPGAAIANQAAQAADAPVHAQIQNDCAKLVPATN